MFADIDKDDLIEEQTNVIKTERLVKHVLKLEIYLNDLWTTILRFGFLEGFCRLQG